MAHELVLGPHLKRWRIRYAAAPGTREHADQACDRNKDERNLRHGQYHPIPPQACAYPWTFTSPIRQQATTQEADYAECDQLPWTDD